MTMWRTANRSVSTALIAALPVLLVIAAKPVAAQGTSPTFTKDVAPILQRSCQRCHRPGSIAPMPLLTYQDARPWARSIRAQVANRSMPPWHIDRSVGISKFKNDISLTDAEIETITRWVDAGAPQGDPAAMPAPVKFADVEVSNRWIIGEPDIILNIPEDVVVASKGSDKWPDLELEDVELPEDRYIKALEIKPTKGHRVVHHANASFHAPDGTRSHIVEYAVGKGGEIYPDGAGKLLPAGSRFTVGLHLHSIGEEIPANVALGIKLYPKGYKPDLVHVTRIIGQNEELDLPPGEPNARTDGYTILQAPIRLTAFQPHMHNRGKRQCLEVIYPPSSSNRWTDHNGPDRARQELISCADFQFNWHIQYVYDDEVAPLLPKGTVLHLISWHDNSAGHKSNPDPTNWIGFGHRTVDEMALAWITYSQMTEEQYQAAVRAREERRRTTAQNQQP